MMRRALIVSLLFPLLAALLLLGRLAVAQEVGRSPAVASQLGGSTTNDSAAAGNLGEFISATALGTTATITVTIATPGVVTWTTHGFSTTAPAPVNFTTTGALPTGLVVGTTYWTIPSTVTASTFQLASSVANAIIGTAINTSGTQSGVQTGVATATLATTTTQNVTGMQLTAGEWEVNANCWFKGGGTTTVSWAECGISTASQTMPTGGGSTGQITPNGATIFAPGIDPTLRAGPTRLSLSATTTVFMPAVASFGTAAMSAYGTMQARRPR